MNDTDANDLMEGALAFAKTLREKPLAEQIGLLLLAFDGMDVASAKAIVLLQAH